MIPVFLASRSPRRQDLIKLVVTIEGVLDPLFDESNHNPVIPEEVVQQHAVGKNLSIQSSAMPHDYCLISSDTVVVHDHSVLGKPGSLEEAVQFLQRLSGNEHTVITGVCIRIQEKENKLFYYFHDTAFVRFEHIPLDSIKRYVDQEKPLDKAGGYGLQELPEQWVNEVKGDENNVIGLPVIRLRKELTWLSYFFQIPLTKLNI